MSQTTQPPPRDHSEIELARNVTMKALTNRLPNEQPAVLRHVENMIFEAAVNDSKGDHSKTMDKYNATLRLLASDAKFGPVLLAAKKEFAEQQSIVSKSNRTARASSSKRTRHRPPQSHPIPGTSVEPSLPTWFAYTVVVIFGFVTLYAVWCMHDISKLNLLVHQQHHVSEKD